MRRADRENDEAIVRELYDRGQRLLSQRNLVMKKIISCTISKLDIFENRGMWDLDGVNAL